MYDVVIRDHNTVPPKYVCLNLTQVDKKILDLCIWAEPRCKITNIFDNQSVKHICFSPTLDTLKNRTLPKCIVTAVTLIHHSNLYQ